MQGIATLHDGENWISHLNGRDFRVMDPYKSFTVEGVYLTEGKEKVDERDYSARFVSTAIRLAKLDGLTKMVSVKINKIK